jgi:hypothetical protein
VDPRAGLEAVEKNQILTLLGLKLKLITQPVAVLTVLSRLLIILYAHIKKSITMNKTSEIIHCQVTTVINC